MISPFQVPPRLHLPQHGEVVQNGEAVYQVGAEIGKGYFGKVYACTDQWGNDLVAKILIPQQDSYEQVRGKWSLELKNLLMLRHPNITYAYDAFEHKTTFYLIMERCAGDLNRLLSLPQFPREMWLPHIARDILQALHFMHRHNYVHKDLHPGNIFIGWTRDRVNPQKDPVYSFKIGDLGITRLETDINVFGTILAPWMRPPESYAPREFGLIDRRVDIYHVGLLLLSLLLGHFPSFTPEQILAGAPRDMAAQHSSVYAPVIAKALRRHVAQRPQSAAVFWQELATIIPPPSGAK